jgi:hypothetical protein
MSKKNKKNDNKELYDLAYNRLAAAMDGVTLGFIILSSLWIICSILYNIAFGQYSFTAICILVAMLGVASLGTRYLSIKYKNWIGRVFGMVFISGSLLTLNPSTDSIVIFGITAIIGLIRWSLYMRNMSADKEEGDGIT